MTGKEFKSRLKKMKLTQREAADILTKPVRTIQHWCTHGVYDPVTLAGIDAIFERSQNKGENQNV